MAFIHRLIYSPCIFDLAFLFNIRSRVYSYICLLLNWGQELCFHLSISSTFILFSCWGKCHYILLQFLIWIFVYFLSCFWLRYWALYFQKLGKLKPKSSHIPVCPETHHLCFGWHPKVCVLEGKHQGERGHGCCTWTHFPLSSLPVDFACHQPAAARILFTI